MKVRIASGLQEIAKFEKGIKKLSCDLFGILIIFDDNSQAYLLPNEITLMREKRFRDCILDIAG